MSKQPKGTPLWLVFAATVLVAWFGRDSPIRSADKVMSGVPTSRT